MELNNCSNSLWFYLRSVVIAVLLVVVGPITGLYRWRVVVAVLLVVVGPVYRVLPLEGGGSGAVGRGRPGIPGFTVGGWW
jgi:hypothetical protein